MTWSEPEKRTVEVHVPGCDDVTYFQRDVTEAEFEYLQVLAEEVTEASEFGCQPRMALYHPSEDEYESRRRVESWGELA